ncbi:unnamed protein product [Brassica oleracea]
MRRERCWSYMTVYRCASLMLRKLRILLLLTLKSLN